MNENHHTFEAHTESAADHFCDRCFGHHRWDAYCPEDDSVDDEFIDFEPLDDVKPLRIELVHGSPLIHRVTAWRIPAGATDNQVKEAMRYWMPATYCQHEHDCCGHYYANEPQLLGRTYANSREGIAFVLQTHIMNV